MTSPIFVTTLLSVMIISIANPVLTLLPLAAGATQLLQEDPAPEPPPHPLSLQRQYQPQRWTMLRNTIPPFLPPQAITSLGLVKIRTGLCPLDLSVILLTNQVMSLVGAGHIRSAAKIIL